MATGPVTEGDALEEIDDTVEGEDPEVDVENEEDFPAWLRV